METKPSTFSNGTTVDVDLSEFEKADVNQTDVSEEHMANKLTDMVHDEREKLSELAHQAQIGHSDEAEEPSASRTDARHNVDVIQPAVTSHTTDTDGPVMCGRSEEPMDKHNPDLDDGKPDGSVGIQAHLENDNIDVSTASSEKTLSSHLTHVDVTDMSGERLDVTDMVSGEHPNVTDMVSRQRPDVTDKVSGEHPDVTYAVSEECPDVTDMVSEERPDVTYTVSGQRPDVTDMVSGQRPDVTDMVSGEHPDFTYTVSEEHPDVTEMVSGQRPDVTDMVSGQRPDVTDMVSGQRPDVTDMVSGEHPDFTYTVSEEHPDVTEMVSGQRPDVTDMVSGQRPDVTDMVSGEHPDFTYTVSEEHPDVTDMVSEERPDVTYTVSGQRPDVTDMVSGQCPDVTDMVSGEHPDFTYTVSGQRPDVTDMVSGQCPDVTDMVSGEHPDFTYTVSEEHPDVTDMVSGERFDVSDMVSGEHPDVTDMVSGERPDVTDMVSGERPVTDIVSGEHPDVTYSVSEERPEERPDVTDMVSEERPDVSDMSVECPDVAGMPVECPDVTDMVSEECPDVTDMVSEECPDVTDMVSGERPNITYTVSEERPDVTDMVSGERFDVSDMVSGEHPDVTDMVSGERPDVTDMVSGERPVTDIVSGEHPDVTYLVSEERPEERPDVTDMVSVECPDVADMPVECPDVTDMVSEECPDVTDKVSGECSDVTDLVSGERPDVADMVSGERPDVADMVSGECPDVTDMVSGKRPDVTDMVSGKRPDVTDMVSEERPDVTDIVSGERPDVADMVSGELPDVTDKVSGERPDVTDMVSGEHPDVTDMVSGELPDITDVLSEECPDVTYTLSEERPDVTDIVSGERPDVADMVSGERPDVTDKVSGERPDVTDMVSGEHPDVTDMVSGELPDITDMLSEECPDVTYTLSEECPDVTNMVSGERPKVTDMVSGNRPDVTEMSREGPDVTDMVFGEGPDVTDVMSGERPDVTDMVSEECPDVTGMVSRERPEVTDGEDIGYENFAPLPANEPVIIILSDSDEEKSEKTQNGDNDIKREKVHIKFKKWPQHFRDASKLKLVDQLRDELQSDGSFGIQAHLENDNIDASTARSEKTFSTHLTHVDVTDMVSGECPDVTDMSGEHPDVTDMSGEGFDVTDMSGECLNVTDMSGKRPNLTDMVSGERPDVTDMMSEERPDVTDMMSEERLDVTDMSGECPDVTDMSRERPDVTDTVSGECPDVTDMVSGKRSDVVDMVSREYPDVTAMVSEERPDVTDTVSEERPDVTDGEDIGYENFEFEYDFKVDEVPKAPLPANEPVIIILSDSDEEKSEKTQNGDNDIKREKVHIKFKKWPQHVRDASKIKFVDQLMDELQSEESTVKTAQSNNPELTDSDLLHTDQTISNSVSDHNETFVSVTKGKDTDTTTVLRVINSGDDWTNSNPSSCILMVTAKTESSSVSALKSEDMGNKCLEGHRQISVNKVRNVDTAQGKNLQQLEETLEADSTLVAKSQGKKKKKIKNKNAGRVQPVKKSSAVCKHWASKGYCLYENQCNFMHSPDLQAVHKPVCQPEGVTMAAHQEFVTEKESVIKSTVEGPSSETRSHKPSPFAPVCKHYVKKGQCPLGNNCAFRHVTDLHSVGGGSCNKENFPQQRAVASSASTVFHLKRKPFHPDPCYTKAKYTATENKQVTNMEQMEPAPPGTEAVTLPPRGSTEATGVISSDLEKEEDSRIDKSISDEKKVCPHYIGKGFCSYRLACKFSHATNLGSGPQTSSFVQNDVTSECLKKQSSRNSEKYQRYSTSRSRSRDRYPRSRSRSKGRYRRRSRSRSRSRSKGRYRRAGRSRSRNRYRRRSGSRSTSRSWNRRYSRSRSRGRYRRQSRSRSRSPVRSWSLLSHKDRRKMDSRKDSNMLVATVAPTPSGTQHVTSQAAHITPVSILKGVSPAANPANRSSSCLPTSVKAQTEVNHKKFLAQKMDECKKRIQNFHNKTGGKPVTLLRLTDSVKASAGMKYSLQSDTLVQGKGRQGRLSMHMQGEQLPTSTPPHRSSQWDSSTFKQVDVQQSTVAAHRPLSQLVGTTPRGMYDHQTRYSQERTKTDNRSWSMEHMGTKLKNDSLVPLSHQSYPAKHFSQPTVSQQPYPAVLVSQPAVSYQQSLAMYVSQPTKSHQQSPAMHDSQSANSHNQTHTMHVSQPTLSQQPYPAVHVSQPAVSYQQSPVTGGCHSFESQIQERTLTSRNEAVHSISSQIDGLRAALAQSGLGEHQQVELLAKKLTEIIMQRNLTQNLSQSRNYQPSNIEKMEMISSSHFPSIVSRGGAGDTDEQERSLNSQTFDYGHRDTHIPDQPQLSATFNYGHTNEQERSLHAQTFVYGHSEYQNTANRERYLAHSQGFDSGMPQTDYPYPTHYPHLTYQSGYSAEDGQPTKQDGFGQYSSRDVHYPETRPQNLPSAGQQMKDSGFSSSTSSQQQLARTIQQLGLTGQLSQNYSSGSSLTSSNHQVGYVFLNQQETHKHSSTPSGSSSCSISNQSASKATVMQSSEESLLMSGVPSDMTSNRPPPMSYSVAMKGSLPDQPELKQDLRLGKQVHSYIEKFVRTTFHISRNVKVTAKKYDVPQKCGHLNPPEIRPDLFTTLPDRIQNADLLLKGCLKWFSKAIVPVLEQVDMFGKKPQAVADVVRRASDALTLLGYVCVNLSIKRRMLLMKGLPSQYHILCRSSNAITDQLFGDTVADDMIQIAMRTYAIKQPKEDDVNYRPSFSADLAFSEKNIDDSVADMINLSCTSEGNVDDLMEKYKIPANCQYVLPPKLNHQIRNLLASPFLVVDHKLKKIQLTMCEAMVPCMYLLESVHEKRYNECAALGLLTDSMVLMGSAVFQLNTFRLDNMKRTLPTLLQGACSWDISV